MRQCSPAPGIFVWMENLYHLKGEPSDQEWSNVDVPDCLWGKGLGVHPLY